MTTSAYQSRGEFKDTIWPNNKRIAVVFNLAYEMWTPDSHSNVGPMGNLLPEGTYDPNADSYGRYNSQAGIPRLIRILDRYNVKGSLLTSGMVAEHHPKLVKRYAETGHEIVAHAYAQNLLFPLLNNEEAYRAIASTTELIESAIGRRPTGWISPRVTSSIEVQAELARQGYVWHGDVLDDDLPYKQHFKDRSILAIPMSIEFNDLPHAMRFGRTPRQFVESFVDTIMALKEQPAETLVIDVFAHGHCYGRAAAAWAIDAIVKFCVQDSDIWLTTRSEIATYCLSNTEPNDTE